MLKTALEILFGNCFRSLRHINIFLYRFSVMAGLRPWRLASNVTETRRPLGAKSVESGELSISNFQLCLKTSWCYCKAVGPMVLSSSKNRPKTFLRWRILAGLCAKALHFWLLPTSPAAPQTAFPLPRCPCHPVSFQSLGTRRRLPVSGLRTCHFLGLHLPGSSVKPEVECHSHSVTFSPAALSEPPCPPQS